MSRSTLQDFGGTSEFSVHDSTDQGSSRYGEVPGEGPRWGKHPGVVVNPVDPEFRGRMLVQVPDVWGPNVSSWAHPCVPWGGLTMGMYVVPPIGANVWVEFLNGDTERPIWTGFWWGSLADPPPSTKLSATGVTPQLFMESILKHALVISDVPLPPYLPFGGVLLKSGASYIAIEPKGIRIFGAPAVAINGAPSGDPATAALYIT
ncbi:phage baseplate assembly protein V [Methylobacter marinus]|uniref:phage baseplate assembly protein V n=1 Tax=Methylobacter marinus TaxID=34058 RepID=UPI0012EC2CEE|nr:phage baseplate assembly protein V [Methylobacter marinus]